LSGVSGASAGWRFERLYRQRSERASCARLAIVGLKDLTAPSGCTTLEARQCVRLEACASSTDPRCQALSENRYRDQARAVSRAENGAGAPEVIGRHDTSSQPTQFDHEAFVLLMWRRDCRHLRTLRQTPCAGAEEVRGEPFRAVGSHAPTGRRLNRLHGRLERGLSHLVARSSSREDTSIAKAGGRIEWSFGRKRGLEI
jgi:hypothetical protein